MDRKPAGSNGRSYLQSPSGGLKPKSAQMAQLQHLPDEVDISPRANYCQSELIYVVRTPSQTSQPIRMSQL